MAEAEKKPAVPLLERLKDWLNRAIPGLMAALILAAIGLFVDSINLKRDMAHVQWHNTQQDVRLDRAENRQDRSEQQRAEDQREETAFRGETLHRLDILLEMRERDRRRRER